MSAFVTEMEAAIDRFFAEHTEDEILKIIKECEGEPSDTQPYTAKDERRVG